MLAMWCSNEAIKYVSYPVQTLGKSCKMIPVMIGQVVFDGRTHPAYKYVCVVLMAAGVAAFNLLRMKKKAAGSGSPEEDEDGMSAVVQEAIGMSLLAGSLLCDMYTGPNQDRVLKEYAGSNRQLMAVQNLFGALAAIVMLAVKGELIEGPKYLLDHPQVLQAVLIFSAASAIGQLFVFAMLYYFDSLLLTTVTTVRKFMTIVVSDLKFKHGLKSSQWASVVLVFAAIAYDKIVARFLPPPLGGKKGEKKHESKVEDPAQDEDPSQPKNDGPGASSQNSGSRAGSVRRRKRTTTDPE